MKKLSMILLVLCVSAFCAWASQGRPGTDVNKAALAGVNTRTLTVVTTLCNGLVCVQLSDDGEFNIGTPDGRSLLFVYPQAPWSTNIIISVDGRRHTLELVSRPICDDSATFDSWTNDGTSITANYTLSGMFHVAVIHTPVMFNATSGAVLTRTIVTNNDPTGASHTIGVLYEYDTDVDQDDAAQLYLGPNYVTVETCYDAPFAANYWDAIPASASLVGRGTFSGGQAVTPDHLAFGSWSSFYAVCWSHVCSGSPYGDSAVLYTWDETPVPNGASRDVATYYGVGTLDVQPGNLRISASLPPLECEDPLGVQPNPFELLINISNTGGSACQDISVHMSDGTGPGGTAMITSTNPQTIPSIASSSSSAFSFTAQLSPLPAGGCVNFTVNVTSADCEPNELTFCVNVPPCAPLNCEFPYELSDLGDLFRCNYPTTDGNPAHGLSGIAWLGERITGEVHPHIFNADVGDDGVFFPNIQWFPCRVYPVIVQITAGPNYLRYIACGGHLYLNAWKDGNLDNDFCDELCNGTASEWILQDIAVRPGIDTFWVTDPGVYDMGVYAGIFRFRLTSQPVGRFGFGLGDHVLCPSCSCPGTYARDFLGEVEDYYMQDFQLPVTLANFDATSQNGTVEISWSTASETENDRFELLRDDAALAAIHSQGNTASGHSYRYTDRNVVNGNSYTYTLVSIDQAGSHTVLGTRTVTANGTSPATITEYALRQNYPNPFNPTTQIAFDLVESGTVTLTVYNPMGQEVGTLVHGDLNAGAHTITFNAAGLPSGLYFYRLEANGYSASKKMLLMK